jgi:hypothetical protein
MRKTSLSQKRTTKKTRKMTMSVRDRGTVSDLDPFYDEIGKLKMSLFKDFSIISGS